MAPADPRAFRAAPAPLHGREPAGARAARDRMPRRPRWQRAVRGPRPALRSVRPARQAGAPRTRGARPGRARHAARPLVLAPPPTAFAEPANAAYNRRVGLRATGTIGAALMLLLAPAAHAGHVG